jgi:hypothetical protein
LARDIAVVEKMVSAHELFRSGQQDPAVAALRAAYDQGASDPAVALSLYGQGAYFLRQMLKEGGKPSSDDIFVFLLQKNMADAARHQRPWAGLAMKYIDARKMQAWHTFIDKRITEAGEDSDAKAFWLMAKGCGAAYEPEGKFEPRRGGIQWVEQAVRTARADSVRLTAITELALYYEGMNRCEVGISFLDSVKDQFGGNMLGEILDTQSRLRKTDLANRTAAEASSQERREAQRLSLLEYYRKRLKAAEDGSDRAEAEGLKAAITELENQAPR